ncbi:uncharacterized protein [Aristolochia californica]|uniref:uncharacterized protein n=1 Tax=Aristolochia californica TaxID=171875 RepID=UPI0035DC3A01
MVVIPVRFKRATAPFDETARARLCESSGSDHSAGSSSPELADLVDSFIERHDGGDYNRGGDQMEGEDCSEDEEERTTVSMKKKKKRKSDDAVERHSESDTEETLEMLFGRTAATERIREETERAMVRVGEGESVKRAVMAELRERGLDAGLCKSRWEKTGRSLAGEYEYIDVVAGDDRYIVEINLAGEFAIARPTGRYLALLAHFPPVFVGKPEALKRIVRLMCTAVKESLESNELYLPPWRRTGYVQAKWFGTYKRTTNRRSARNELGPGGGFAGKRDVGFAATAATATAMARRSRCGGEVVMEGLTRGGGNLAATFNHMHL